MWVHSPETNATITRRAIDLADGRVTLYADKERTVVTYLEVNLITQL